MMRIGRMSQFIQIAKGGVAVRKICKDAKAQTQYILAYEGIGDWCFTLAFLRQYQRNHSIKNIYILSSNPNQEVFRYFKDQFDGIQIITEKERNELIEFFKSDIGYIYRQKSQVVAPFFPLAYVRSDCLKRNPYISFMHIFKGLLRIDQNSKPFIPNPIPADQLIDRLVRDNVIEKGNTVLLNPYANSCTGIPFSFFEKLAKGLKKKSYKVITSIHDDQVAVPGSEGVAFTISEELALLNYCGYVIGSRSGFLDLAVFSQACIVSIDIDSYPFSDFFKLDEMWPHNKNIRTYRWHEDKEDEMIQQIIDYIETNADQEKR
jgi:hypothetical protein